VPRSSRHYRDEWVFGQGRSEVRHCNPGVAGARAFVGWVGSPSSGGLVEKPEAWSWSSYRHYATGELGAVEIESSGPEREETVYEIPDPRIKT
jgi:hypothetical protein